MLLRLPVLFLSFASTVSFGQSGLFGPVSSHLTAGDIAPDPVFGTVFNSPGSTSWSSDRLVGRLTVLALFPDTSHNTESTARWNALVDRFAGEPVQFVWITAEGDASLLPWLQDHPLKGWVVRDANGETGRSFGMEMPAAILVGSDRKILGFDQEFVPAERTIRAALEGRTTTAPPGTGRAALRDFIASDRVLLDAEPPRMPRPGDRKPDFPPSFVVHISPSRGEQGNFGGDDFRSLQNYGLKDLIAELWNVNPVRIQLPTGLDDGKQYDVAMVLPKAESHEGMVARMRQGVLNYFRVTASRETRTMGVYVVTAPAPKLSAMKPHPEDAALSFTDSYSVDFSITGDPGDFPELPKAVPLSDIRAIAVEGTLDKFCHALESSLDRPVVNESGLGGEFVFRVKSSDSDRNDFLERLRSELGIAITFAKRAVEMVVLQ